MNAKLSLLATCLAVGLATVAPPSEAGFWDLYSKSTAPKNNAPAPQPVAPPPAIQAPENTVTHPVPTLPSARYPNGLGWRAIELDFIDVKARISVVEGKVDDVKTDTETILYELDNVDADHVIITNDLADIKSDLANVSGDVTDMADDVAMLKNALQVQASVAPASAESRNEVNDAPVTLFVQVIQNGAGLPGLTVGAFTFSNSFPIGGAVGYCGASVCITEFSEGQDGLYALELSGDWVAGAYAGTLAAQDSGTTASGTSLVTFEIPEEPAAP